ncbi:MAG: hypothetical protein MK179_02160 [Pirellulaceae bacterium]|nr:hypothetical protein [Pirellulaceae bacterium]
MFNRSRNRRRGSGRCTIRAPLVTGFTFIQRRATIGWLFAVAAIVNRGQVDAQNHLDPSPKPVMQNGDFEEWVEGHPVGWNLDRGKIFADDQFKMRGKRSVCIQVDPQDTMKWPYCRLTSDTFTLEPNTGYRMQLWITAAFQGWVEAIVYAKQGNIEHDHGRVVDRHKQQLR